MKNLLVLIFIMCGCVSSQARIAQRSADDINRSIEAVMADAKLKFVPGDNDVFTTGEKSHWRNGLERCTVVSCLNKKDEISHLGFLLEECEDWDNNKHYYEVKMSKGVPRVINRKGVTVKHQVAGQWDMLVFRNSAGAVIDVALKITGEDDAINDMKDMFNGVWASNKGDTAVFGAIYGDKSYWLPGANYVMNYMPRDYEGKGKPELVVQYVNERMKRVEMPVISKKVDENGVTHYYGDGKEISKQEYEFIESRPCGYGGHGSLHGPLLWWIKPSGNNLLVELNEPFREELDAFYSNFRDEKFTLNWVRSPYKNMKDRWAVVSMRPLTRGMLSFFDKATLRLMLKSLSNRKTLTDMERLNKSLITTILNGK